MLPQLLVLDCDQQMERVWPVDLVITKINIMFLSKYLKMLAISSSDKVEKVQQ